MRQPSGAAGLDTRLRQMERDLAEGLVPLAVYNDPDIYERELERIFSRCWIFLAHESEIPQPGDYVLRYIAHDPWIVVRDQQGAIQVLFDSCRHRGTQLCRADQGNAAHFRCPYHGWTYRNDGALVGVPNRSQAYQGLDEEQWGLLHPPQVDCYRGLIFACLDAETPSLPNYLGDFRWYLDIHLALNPGGMEVLGEPHRWRLDADWKSGAENFSGDSYHTQTLHRSIMEVGLAPKSPPSQFGTRGEQHQHVTECNGHATSIRRAAEGEAGFWGYPPEVVRLFRQDELSDTQYELARTTTNTTGTIFPNLSLIHTGPTDDPQKPPATYLSFRQWQPKGPGAMEIWSWVLAPKEASQAYKERAYKAAVASFSPSGNFEQDDTIVWHGIARSARSLFARKVNAKLNYQMGLESMSEARPERDWPGPGLAFDSNLEEGVQRTFFRHWLREMTRP